MKGKQLRGIGVKAMVAIISLYGIYAMISRQIWNEMFLLIEFSFFDYGESALFFFTDYAAIMILFVVAAYYGKKGIQREKVRGNCDERRQTRKKFVYENK